MATSGAPKPISSLLIDRPVVDANGVIQPWFAQVMQRLLDYVGSPSTGSSGTSGGGNVTQTLTDQLTVLTNNQYTGVGSPPGDGSLYGRVAALESAVPPLPGFVTVQARHLQPLAPTWLSNGQEAASEGTGTPVLDPVHSNSGTALFRSLIGASGISVGLTADGTGIIIALTAGADLTSGGTLVSSSGTQITSGL